MNINRLIKQAIFVFLTFVALIFNKTALAAGPNFYDCVKIFGTCQVGGQNCGVDYAVPVPDQCKNVPIDQCASTDLPCIKTTDPSNSCNAQGGAPNLGSCPDGSDPLPCIDCTPPFICCADPNNPNNPGILVQNAPPLSDCPGGKGIETAIGCIPVESEQELALFFLKWGMGLGGGIALIVMAISSFMMISSAGDPRKLQAGKELLMSAITGLGLLVLSAWILNFIGVEILDIFPSGGNTGGGPGPIK